VITIPQYHRETDRQTTSRSNTALCVASHSKTVAEKNEMKAIKLKLTQKNSPMIDCIPQTNTACLRQQNLLRLSLFSVFDSTVCV